MYKHFPDIKQNTLSSTSSKKTQRRATKLGTINRPSQRERNRIDIDTSCSSSLLLTVWQT